MQKLDVSSVKFGGRQTSGHISTGVDAHSKTELLRIPRGRVAVDDDAATEDVPGSKEWIADPQLVRFGLAIERHAWPHARMHEVIISAVIAQRERMKKI